MRWNKKSPTGYINTYNNSLLKARRNLSKISNSKFNKNSLITFKNDKLPKPSENQIINPLFITGFVDGEGGCFLVSITKNKNFKLGWKVHLLFAISLHKRDKALLEQIQNYFKVRSINWTHEPKSIKFRVQSIKDLRAIIYHFYKYPLITKKSGLFVIKYGSEFNSK